MHNDICDRCSKELTTFDEDIRMLCDECHAKECQYMEDETKESYNGFVESYKGNVEKLNNVRKMFGLPELQSR